MGCGNFALTCRHTKCLFILFLKTLLVWQRPNLNKIKIKLNKRLTGISCSKCLSRISCRLLTCSLASSCQATTAQPRNTQTRRKLILKTIWKEKRSISYTYHRYNYQGCNYHGYNYHNYGYHGYNYCGYNEFSVITITIITNYRVWGTY